jgi:hypothetical protein
LQSAGRHSLAVGVLQFAQQNFAVSGPQVAKSPDPLTYNVNWEAPGTFSGMAPYAGGGAPQILWAEGTASAAFASAAVGVPFGALEDDLAQFAAVSATAGSGPLTANQTMRNDAWDTDFHAWLAVAAAWTILAGEQPSPALS